MDKYQRLARRKMTIRKKVHGTVERPRMLLTKSLKNMTTQIIDDNEGKTIFGLSTLSKDISLKLKKANKSNVASAMLLGEEVAKGALKKGIKKVVFDRAGNKYHGVVKAFADSARKSGLEF
ncbi:MAG: 50S ribosomal protein L18 [Candidatus Omnitrophica bacterium]|nr:50S ribosomal protein L18 [Candidatus Omnitrophota bacterium]